MNRFSTTIVSSFAAERPGGRMPPDSDILDRLRNSPYWDPGSRTLFYQSTIVKQFNWPAANQELLLGIFQARGWPKRIGDPLPITDGISPKQRLHDTIKCLNRRRLVPLVRFHGDGTGRGVCWELCEPSIESTITTFDESLSAPCKDQALCEGPSSAIT